MKNLTWQNPEQLFVAQELINKVKSKCCGIKDKLKANLDLAKIKDESWPRQSEFTLTESDIDDIIDFCEDHALPESGTELSFSKISEMNKEFSKSSEDLTVEFYGDTLKYKVHHSDLQKGYYLRLVFAGV